MYLKYSYLLRNGVFDITLCLSMEVAVAYYYECKHVTRIVFYVFSWCQSECYSDGKELIKFIIIFYDKVLNRF